MCAAVARARKRYKTGTFWHGAQKVMENAVEFERFNKQIILSETAARQTLRTQWFQGHEPTKPVTATTQRFKKHVETTNAPKCAKTKSLKFVGKMSGFEHAKKIMFFCHFQQNTNRMSKIKVAISQGFLRQN